MFRGLGVVLPPLLTLVVLIWAWNAIESYVLRPMETGVRHGLVLVLTRNQIKREVPKDAVLVNPAVPAEGFTFQGERYVLDPTRSKFLPEYVVKFVDDNLDRLGPYQAPPVTANAYWHRYVELRYLPRSFIVPLFLLVFLSALLFSGVEFLPTVSDAGS